MQRQIINLHCFQVCVYKHKLFAENWMDAIVEITRFIKPAKS